MHLGEAFVPRRARRRPGRPAGPSAVESCPPASARGHLGRVLLRRRRAVTSVVCCPPVKASVHRGQGWPGARRRVAEQGGPRRSRVGAPGPVVRPDVSGCSRRAGRRRPPTSRRCLPVDEHRVRRLRRRVRREGGERCVTRPAAAAAPPLLRGDAPDRSPQPVVNTASQGVDTPPSRSAVRVILTTVGSRRCTSEAWPSRSRRRLHHPHPRCTCAPSWVALPSTPRCSSYTAVSRPQVGAVAPQVAHRFCTGACTGARAGGCPRERKGAATCVVRTAATRSPASRTPARPTRAS